MAIENRPSQKLVSDYLAKLGTNAGQYKPFKITGVTKGVDNYNADVDASGNDFLSWLGDIVSRPLFAVTETASSIADLADKNQKFDPLSAIGNVVSAPFRGFFSTNPADKIYTGDLIEKVADIAGANSNPNYVNKENNVDPVVKGVAGFVGDVALDPTTYIGLGLYKKLGEKIAGGVTKTAAKASKAMEATPVLGTAIKAAQKAAETVVPTSTADEVVDVAAQSKVVADAQVAEAANDIVKESVTQIPADVTRYLDKSLNEVIKAKRIKGGKSSVLAKIENYTNSFAPADDVIKAGILRTEKIDSFDEYLGEVIKVNKAYPGELNTRLTRNGESLVIKPASEAAKAVKFLKSPKAAEVRALETAITKAQSIVSSAIKEESRLLDLPLSAGNDESLKAVAARIQGGEKLIAESKAKIEAIRESTPELSIMAELYGRFLGSFEGRGVTGVSLFGDVVAVGKNETLDALHMYRLEYAYDRQYVEELFGRQLARELSNLGQQKFDTYVNGIAQLLRPDGVIADSAIALGMAPKNSLAGAQANFLKHVGIDYPSFQKALQIANNRIVVSPLTAASSTDETLQAYFFTEKLGEFAAKYRLGGADEAQVVNDIVIDAIPEVVTKNFDKKSIVQTHNVPHTKNPDVLRDSPIFGEGTGIDIKNANTYTQADLYVALATRVNKYLRTIEKDKGWGAIAIRTRMMRAATKSAEDYFAANGIYLHLDQGARKPRFALTMTNILDTLLPLEEASKGTNRDAQQLISAALYNVEGKPKFADDVQIAQVGSAVKASIFMDATVVALNTGDVEAVKAALMTTTRRNGGDLENWLSKPEAIGRVGFVPKKMVKFDPVTKEIVTPIAGTFAVKGKNGVYMGIKAKTIIDNVAQMLVDSREELLALAKANEELIGVTRKANIFAITAAATKNILAHAADPMLRAQSLRELADVGAVVDDVAAKAGADSVANAAAHANVDAAIDPVKRTVARSAVKKSGAQEAETAAKTKAEKAKAAKQVEDAQAARMKAAADEEAQIAEELRASPDNPQDVQDILDASGGARQWTDEAYAGIKVYVMKSPFLSRMAERFVGSWGLKSSKLNLFRLARTSMALTRIVRGERTKAYRQLGIEYGNLLQDGKTTELTQALRNIQLGLIKDVNPRVTEAMAKLQPMLAELFDFQSKADSAVLGNAFFQEGAGLEYLNNLMKQYDILKPNGKEVSAELKKFINEGTDFFDLDRAMAERALILRRDKRDIGLLAAAADQWREWPIDDAVDFLAKADVVVLHAASEAAIVESVKRLGVAPAAGWASRGAKEGFVQLESGGRLLQMFPADMHFDPEVASMLVNLEKLSTKTTEINSFFTNVYDPIQQAWQFGITQLRPGHHLRNLIGDETTTYFAEGTKYQIRSAKDAFKLQAIYGQYDNTDFLRMLNQMGDVTIPKAGDVMVNGKYGEITAATLAEAIARNGLPTSKIVDDIFDAESATGKIAKIARGVVFQDTKLGEFVGGVSEARDHWSRMKHFMQIIHKEQNAKVKRFKTTEELFSYASQRVQKFHPDSTTLSKFEQKYMRRLVPFYGWMRGAIPALVESAFTNPGRITSINKASYNLAIAMGVNPDSLYDPFPEDQLFPSFLTDKVQGPQFQVDGKYYSVSPGVVSWDISNQFLADPLRGSIGSLNPILRMPIELLTGSSLGTGARIRDTSDYVDSAIPGLNYLASVSGYSPTGSLVSMLQGMGPDPMAQVLLGNRTDTSAALSAVNWLTGLGISEYSRPNYINLAEIERRNREAAKASIRSAY